MTERRQWERRHRDAAGATPPSEFVTRHARRIAERHPGALALDLACGGGRHTRLLEELGFRAIAVDFARAALERAAPPPARAHGVLAEAMHLPFRDGTFALVVQTCFLERALFPSLARLLAPGGVLLAETFSVRQHDATGHPRREYCVGPHELARMCEAPACGLRVFDAASGDRGRAGAPRFLDAVAAQRP